MKGIEYKYFNIFYYFSALTPRYYATRFVSVVSEVVYIDVSSPEASTVTVLLSLELKFYSFMRICLFVETACTNRVKYSGHLKIKHKISKIGSLRQKVKK